MQDAVKNGKFIIINTLHSHEQSCLIKNTVFAHDEERVINEGLLLCDTNCNSSGGGSGNIYLYLHCYYYFIIGFNWKLVPRNTMLLVSLNEEDRSAIKDIR